MLDIQIHPDTHTDVRKVLSEFRRYQVSRFPILALCKEGSPNRIYFIDSRFAEDIRSEKNGVAFYTEKNLGILRPTGELDNHGRRVLTVVSRLIQNEKYASHNPRYREKSTGDPKKLLKLLRDYVKPFSADEIRSGEDTIDESFAAWQKAPASQYFSMANRIHSHDIAEEIMYLTSVGVQFRNEKFREIVANGLELFAEGKRRKSIKLTSVHVYVQPDGSVIVSGDEGIAGTWEYHSVEAAPPSVQHNIAMLKMLDDSPYVPEVGKRLSPVTYRVHVNVDEFNTSNA